VAGDPPPDATLTAWWDEPADGAWNMAADETLAAEAARLGGTLVRLYGWTSTTVSLGAFQPIGGLEHSVPLAGLPVVRRPSGGGAIIHGTDLTYAAAVPRRHPWGSTPRAFYDALHAEMVAELRARGIAARLHAGGPVSPEALLCFDRRSDGDIVASRPGRPAAADDPKIMGSAQRRLAVAVVQHGSLLLRENAAVPHVARRPGLDALAAGGPGGAWPGPESAKDLAAAWLQRVASRLGAGLCISSEPFAEARRDAIAVASRRFRDADWTRRR